MRFLSLFLGTALVTADPARALPILNEVYYDALGSDAPSVFTEILGEPGTILDGWTLVGINGADREIYRRIDLTGAVVPDDGLLVIATGRATLELVLELDFIANVDWQNGPDAVQLWSATNTLVDALQYGDAGPGNAGEGAPVLDAPPGLGLSRRNGSDSDDNATDFVVTAPTPGSACPAFGGAALPVAPVSRGRSLADRWASRARTEAMAFFSRLKGRTDSRTRPARIPDRLAITCRTMKKVGTCLETGECLDPGKVRALLEAIEA